MLGAQHQMRTRCTSRCFMSGSTIWGSEKAEHRVRDASPPDPAITPISPYLPPPPGPRLTMIAQIAVQKGQKPRHSAKSRLINGLLMDSHRAPGKEAIDTAEAAFRTADFLGVMTSAPLVERCAPCSEMETRALST